MKSDPRVLAIRERIRVKIQRHKPSDFIGHAVNALHETYVAGTDGMRTLRPWEILLAIQWILEEATEASIVRIPPSRNDLNVLLNMIYEIGDCVIPGSGVEQVMMFMRKLAFQQFSLQRDADGAAFARQFILFGSLPSNHRLQKDFVKKAGISLREFCLLSFGLLSLALQKPCPRIISEIEFQKLESSLEPGSVANFFRFLAMTIPELREWLLSERRENVTVEDQWILPSPLLHVPLLANAPHEFIVYHPTLMMRSIEAMIYRSFRRSSETFRNVFGKMFERYLGDCLTSAQIKYFDEAALQAAIQEQGKWVDFLVAEQEGCVLIEAKGVEVPPLGKISENAEFLARAMKPAIGAIDQALGVHGRLMKSGWQVFAELRQKPIYLIIVTVEELHLSTSGPLKAALGKSLLQRWEGDNGDVPSIPLENIFFLSVGEFESLLALVSVGKTTIISALRQAQQNNRDPKTQKFEFKQHLASLGLQAKQLPILLHALNSMGDECTSRIASFEAKAFSS